MKHARCPITYELISAHEQYSPKGLRLLSRHLKTLLPLPFNAQELRQEAASHMEKMSIQGVQPKLSARLNIQKNCFEITDLHGTFILKPNSADFPEVPANEAISMKMAELMNIEVPLHGLVYNNDNTLTYFIKRFDRLPRGKKLPVEDFSQLSSNNRETKYQFSMEKLIPIIEKNCTFPLIEKHKLWARVLFNYLIGNEDMHLKNFSLITRKGKTELAPAYDFLNTTIVIKNAREEVALPLNGKKNNITAYDLIQYYAYERLSLEKNIIATTLQNFQKKIPALQELLNISFLSEKMKNAYKNILIERANRLFL